MHLLQAGTITVEQVGSYAGFAAILGLAVLAALYFSQARDVKRLRDWAGRAPERDADARSRVAAATSAGQAQQQQRVATPGAVQPAGAGAATAGNAAAANAGNSGAKTPAGAVSKAPAVAASAGGAGAVGARPGAVPAARALGARPSAQTSILAAQEEPRERWYRRIAPRYIALIVAGVLVVGGGIAVGAIQLLSNDDSSGGAGTTPAEPTAEREPSASTPVKPADVSVAVLNATGLAGLADQFADKAEAQGFKRDNVGNAPGGQRAESVVQYAPGKEREARLVRRKFDISAIEPADPESLKLAPEADTIVVIGADNTQ